MNCQKEIFTMICPACGKMIGSEDRFCGYCGSLVKSSDCKISVHTLKIVKNRDNNTYRKTWKRKLF